MMLIGNDAPIESYKSYKNRVVTKHLDKLKNQLRQIRECSLKEDDKVKLRKQLIEIIQSV